MKFEDIIHNNYSVEEIVGMENAIQVGLLRNQLDTFVDWAMGTGFDPYAVLESLDQTFNDLDRAVGEHEDD